MFPTKTASITKHPLLATLALVAALGSFTGCAAPADDSGDVAVAEQGVASAKEPAIDVVATYRRAYVGVPTYGYEPTAPFVTIEVLVEDAALRGRHAGFDGFERPFALVPKKHEGAVRWERVDLRWRGETRRGYYAERRLDAYEIRDVRISDVDLEAVLAHGIAVGLDTNVGPIWAQDAGGNIAVAKVGSL